jgi:predicted nuclease of predicted toxin-antitoxin system
MPMLRYLADQNFDQRILDGVAQRCPDFDPVLAREAGLSRAPDPELLAWAAANDCVLLTHDIQTIPDFATDRIVAGEPMPGVIVVPQRLPLRIAIEDLTLIVLCDEPRDVVDRILILPL